ncbi:MAG: PspC domain-containing protein [Firmicutes bacterium]|nr:PspC domain-containing protein [Bacillota bacterium]
MTLSSRGKVLYRSTRNTKVAGVAGGISDYFGIDATLVRLAWVALTLASVPAGIVAYTVAAVMIPKEPIN